MQKKIEEIKKQVANGEKIRAGFFVVSLSMMGTKSIFLNLLEDKLFDAKLVVIPNYDSRFIEEEYEKAVKMFGADNVIKSFDIDGESFFQFDGLFDIVFCAYPYDANVIPEHSIEHFAKQGVLTVHVDIYYQIIVLIFL